MNYIIPSVISARFLELIEWLTKLHLVTFIEGAYNMCNDIIELPGENGNHILFDRNRKYMYTIKPNDRSREYNVLVDRVMCHQRAILEIVRCIGRDKISDELFSRLLVHDSDKIENFWTNGYDHRTRSRHHILWMENNIDLVTDDDIEESLFDYESARLSKPLKQLDSNQTHNLMRNKLSGELKSKYDRFMPIWNDKLKNAIPFDVRMITFSRN